MLPWSWYSVVNIFQERGTSSLPPALVSLDTSTGALAADMELLDAIPSRDADTVHVFYVKAGQKAPQDIVTNVVSVEVCVIMQF